MFAYFNYAKFNKSEKFFPRSQGLQVTQLCCEGKTKRMGCFAKKCKTATLFKHSAESTSLPNAQLGPEQNISLFMHLTLPSVCCLARLSLMHLFAGKKNKTPAYLSPSWIAQKCCQVEPDRCGDWIRRRQLHHSPHSSLYINLCLSRLLQLSSWIPLVFVCCKGHRGRAFGDGKNVKTKGVAAASTCCALRVRSNMCGPSRLDVFSSYAVARSHRHVRLMMCLLLKMCSHSARDWVTEGVNEDKLSQAISSKPLPAPDRILHRLHHQMWYFLSLQSRKVMSTDVFTDVSELPMIKFPGNF